MLDRLNWSTNDFDGLTCSLSIPPQSRRVCCHLFDSLSCSLPIPAQGRRVCRHLGVFLETDNQRCHIAFPETRAG